jgi:predicted nucleic acid-binding Zn ribbon protein
MRRTSDRRRFNTGRWNVQRERAQIEDRFPPPSFRDATPIAQTISAIFERLGVEDRRWLTALADEWEQIAGQALARHTRPGRFDGRNLVVFVDSSVWLSELKRYGQSQLLANVRRRPGAEKVQGLQLLPDPEGSGARGGPHRCSS